LEILVIAPEKLITDELSVFFDSQKYNFIFCRDIDFALDFLKDKNIDLVIMEYNYPDNKYDIIFSYLKNNNQEFTPVLTIYRDNDSDYINKIYTSELSDYVHYPFIEGEIIRKIDMHYKISVYKKSKTPDETFDKEWLNQIRTMSNDGLFAWNVLTNDSYFDSGYYTMAGYDPDEFLPTYDEWKNRVHPDDYPESQIQGNTYLQGDLPEKDNDFRFRRKDGSWMWIRAKIRFIKKDSSGKVIQIIGTHSDITKEKQATDELSKLRKYLSSVINSMPTALVGVDTDLTVTQWNRSAEKLIGLNSKSVLGKKLLKAVPQLKSEMVYIKNSLKKNKTDYIRKRIRIDSEKKIWDITVYPISNPEIDGAVLLIRDMTDKIKIDELLVQSEKMLSVGGLAAGMAHELNNPLAGIMQTIYVLNNRLCLKKNSPANVIAAEKADTSMDKIIAFMDSRDIPKMFESIKESGTQMAETISNMLSFSRTDSSRKSLVSLSKILDSSIKLASAYYDMKEKYDFRKINIVRLYEETDPQLKCHSSKIQQVIINLLRNAAQAMSKMKTSNPEIIIKTRMDSINNQVEIEISDNGPGMEPRVQSRIFEPFYTTKPPGIGTGLGLSISYFIITKDHNGEMLVDSHPGKGAKFTLRLPI